MKIKKGDLVKIRAGDDRNKTGKVLHAYPQEGKMVVEKINLHKRHIKSRGQKKPGGIVAVALPIKISNIQLICPKCRLPSQVKFTVAGSEKHRICAKCQEMIN